MTYLKDSVKTNALASALKLMTLLGLGLAFGSDALASRIPVRMVASAQQQVPTKSNIIARLKALQDRQGALAANLDVSIRKILASSQELAIDEDSLRVAAARTDKMAKDIEQLTRRRNEANAQRELLDRVIFAIDSKWTDQPLKPFLETAFLDMASADLADGRDGRLWKAFTYLSICVREVPTPREDLFDVIEAYLGDSGVLAPKTPAEFLASRNYTNGSESVAARGVSRDHVGDDADRRLKPTSVRVPLIAKEPVIIELRNRTGEVAPVTAPTVSQSSPDIVSGTTTAPAAPNESHGATRTQ